MQTGKYVPKSKYQSVNEAVKWSVGLLKATLKYARNKEKLQYLLKIGENEEKIKIFAQKLETRLVSEIDNKIKKNNEFAQSIRDILFPDEYIYAYGVKLEKAIQKTLTELDLPPLPNYAVVSDSIVTSNLFIGNSGLLEHKDVTYHVRQQKKSNNVQNSYRGKHKNV